MNGEDTDYLLRVYDETYPGFRSVLRSLSVPSQTDDTPVGRVDPPVEGAVGMSPVPVYAVLVVTIILCTLIIGVRFNWWTSAVWMVVMSVATYYWHQWRVS